MFDHFPDMNHDGQKDVHDAVIFHSLVDDAKGDGGEPVTRSSVPLPKNKEEAILYNFIKGLFIGVPGLFLYLLFTLPLPINAFTAILALLSIVTILRTLTL